MNIQLKLGQKIINGKEKRATSTVALFLNSQTQAMSNTITQIYNNISITKNYHKKYYNYFYLCLN